MAKEEKGRKEFYDKIYEEKRAKREHDPWEYGTPPKKWKNNNKGGGKGHWGGGGGNKW